MVASMNILSGKTVYIPHRPWFIARQWRGAPFLGLCVVNGDHATIQFMTAEGLLFDSLKLRAK